MEVHTGSSLPQYKLPPFFIPFWILNKNLKWTPFEHEYRGKIFAAVNKHLLIKRNTVATHEVCDCVCLQI